MYHILSINILRIIYYVVYSSYYVLYVILCCMISYYIILYIHGHNAISRNSSSKWNMTTNMIPNQQDLIDLN